VITIRSQWGGSPAQTPRFAEGLSATTLDVSCSLLRLEFTKSEQRYL